MTTCTVFFVEVLIYNIYFWCKSKCYVRLTCSFVTFFGIMNPFQVSLWDFALRANIRIDAEPKDGTIKSTKRLTWEPGGRLTLSKVHPMPRVLFWKKCKQCYLFALYKRCKHMNKFYGFHQCITLKGIVMCILLLMILNHHLMRVYRAWCIAVIEPWYSFWLLLRPRARYNFCLFGYS